MNALVDNDILYKGSCFRILDSLLNDDPADLGVLGAAKYVVPKKIKKAPLKGSPADALAVFEEFVREAQAIEPTDEEQTFAAELELLAQREGLPFDTGESQLCAVLISRGLPELLTGDKRAITALEQLLDLESRLDSARGRVRCLEQLIRLLIDRLSVDAVRAAICAEPSVDRSLTICFSCSSATCSPDSILEGLASYIADVRRSAGRILAAAP